MIQLNKTVIFERHLHAPELNTLHINGKAVKVGFFDMNYKPTLDDAIQYAKRMKLITFNESKVLGNNVGGHLIAT